MSAGAQLGFSHLFGLGPQSPSIFRVGLPPPPIKLRDLPLQAQLKVFAEGCSKSLLVIKINCDNSDHFGRYGH